MILKFWHNLAYNYWYTWILTIFKENYNGYHGIICILVFTALHKLHFRREFADISIVILILLVPCKL